ncbi:MAG: energy transducer TonB, partial [Hymenobacteraceae bacterium]|nr:energy transducer TonB [Hymenobacteraceae bacterium]
NGSLSDLKVTQGLDEACNKESLRVIAEGPKWKPAQNRGEKVRQRVVMPIVFNIPNVTSTDTAATVAVTEKTNVELDEKARPKEGLEQFYARLQQQQRYPKKARKKKVEGKVLVAFVVKENGSITDVEVIQGLGYGLDEEALRLVKSAPAWLPARHEGKPVRQKIILPVVFKL